MKPTLNEKYLVSNTESQPRRPEIAEYHEPKHRMHPMLVAFFATGAATAAFYSAEMFGPAQFKPSYIIGGYESAMAEARKQGELRAEVRYQGQLKQIETAAVQWQEQYKATANGVLQYYQATYQRAGAYAQATADIQKQYMNFRYQIATNTTTGTTTWANLADMFAPIIGVFDPELGAQAERLAESKRAEALAKLDGAAQAGIIVKIDGWDTGLVPPEDVARALRDLPPMKFPAAVPSKPDRH